MNYRFFLPLLVFLLLFGNVLGRPLAPSNVRANAVEDQLAVEISWDYDGQGMLFNVYRGTDFNDAEVIASVEEHSFVDRSVEAEVEYFYFVTTFDGNEESLPSIGFTIILQERPLPPVSELFYLTLVKPKGKVFYFGDTVKLVLQIGSTRLDELRNPKAMIVSEELNLRQDFEFDSEKMQFFLNLQMPEEPEFEASTTTYTYEVFATAELEGEELVDVFAFDISLKPPASLLFTGLEWLQFPLLAMVLVTVALIGWKWIIKKRLERERLELERLGILKERMIWKQEAFKRKISPEQFKEKDAELQGKQLTIEEKLGLRKPGEKGKPNPFQGYKPREIKQIYRLVNAIRKPKRGMDKDRFRAWLVGRGKSERVAKKVAELIYKK